LSHAEDSSIVDAFDDASIGIRRGTVAVCPLAKVKTVNIAPMTKVISHAGRPLIFHLSFVICILFGADGLPADLDAA